MNVLAVGSHWDDIELGCSLTLNDLKKQGNTIYAVVMCKAYYQMEGHQGPSEEEARKNGEASFKRFGVQYIETRKSENGRLAYSKDIMQELEGVANRLEIDTVFTHWYGDINTDHKATWEIARTAFRNVKNFFMFQSNSYSDFVNSYSPNYFFGFSEEKYKFKRDLLALYSTEWEYRQQRWEQEICQREKYWGYLCGHDYAEAFQIGKLVHNCFVNT